jgi:hypothetical protein
VIAQLATPSPFIDAAVFRTPSGVPVVRKPPADLARARHATTATTTPTLLSGCEEVVPLRMRHVIATRGARWTFSRARHDRTRWQFLRSGLEELVPLLTRAPHHPYEVRPMDLSLFLNSLMFSCAAQPGLSRVLLEVCAPWRPNHHRGLSSDMGMMAVRRWWMGCWIVSHDGRQKEASARPARPSAATARRRSMGCRVADRGA